MTVLDVLIVVVAIAFAVRGYQQGLLVGAITLAGFVAGALVGSRIGPALLEGGSDSPYAGLTTLVGGMVIGSIVAAVAETAAQWLRIRILRGRVVGVLDGAAGALLLAALALALAWVLGIVALNTPGLGGVRKSVQSSTILTALNEVLPPSGPILNVLNRVDPRPEISGPQAKVAKPDRAAAADPDVPAAAKSVVRVHGTACGLSVAGSGWVAQPGVVVTNAHVVAGVDDVVIVSGDGTELAGTAIAYEPRNDLAVISVPGLQAAPLAIVGDPAADTGGAIIGYPEDGPLAIEAARIGETVTVSSEDSYGRGPLSREMTPFRGEVRPGNSGGPIVDGEGRVLATVFAATIGKGASSGLGVPNASVTEVLARAQEPVSTGPCTA